MTAFQRDALDGFRSTTSGAGMIEDQLPLSGNATLLFADIIFFGPYRLIMSERLLEMNGKPVQLGGRALDILGVLVERAGDIVSSRDLLTKVWAGVTVDDGSLRVHVSALRKALGDGTDGARYVINVPTKGYCFVGQVTRSHSVLPSTTEALAAGQTHNLPPRLVRMIGRDETVCQVAAQVTARRFVTVIGPGGVGKTTVAVAVAHNLLASFDGSVRFVDLAPISDPLLLPGAFTVALGIAVQSGEPTRGLLAFLKTRRMLIVLDNCEQVIEAVAALAELIFEEAPLTHILATSRETMRVEGEQIHSLRPLGNPPDEIDITAARALVFPAVQLFVERATASSGSFIFTDADAPAVVEICRKLDGIALAIEIAASHVGAYGVDGISTMLDNRFRLLWRGRRTALPRHQTLNATLGWSYNLLPEHNRVILRRLSILVGSFTLKAALAIAAVDDADRTLVLEAIASFVEKSLLIVDTSTGATRYRLLDMTRDFLLEKLVESGEQNGIALSHAIYFSALCKRARSGAGKRPNDQELIRYEEHLDNLRAAAGWSCSVDGSAPLAIPLAAALASILLEMSLLTEAQVWAERGLARLDDSTRGTRWEMELQTVLGQSLMYVKITTKKVNSAFERGLALAEELEDFEFQLRLIGALHVLRMRVGDFAAAAVLAQRSEVIAGRMIDPTCDTTADWLLMISHHFMGNHIAARLHYERTSNRDPIPRRVTIQRFGIDHRVRAIGATARTLWLLGFVDQSVKAAQDAVEEISNVECPIAKCVALIWAATVLLWVGDWRGAKDIIGRIIAISEPNDLAPYHEVALGLAGELSLRRGDAKAALRLLQGRGGRHQLTTSFVCSFAESLAMTGQYHQALTTVEKAIAQANRTGEMVNLPEFLRIKGHVLIMLEEPDIVLAEKCHLDSLALARRQSALSWELRTATSLASMYGDAGRQDEARAHLIPVYDRFTEGFETADLRAARHLLGQLA